jgi:hypothetical protein
MDINIRLILNRKKAGIDCTEAESAEIKGYLKEFKFPFEQTFVSDIQELFPIEYGEFLDEEDINEDINEEKERGISITVIGADGDGDILQRRIEAGLDVNPCQYTRMDMIRFANKAISAYIGNALIVDGNLKLNHDWIDDNL